VAITTRQGFAVSVVLASSGYPGSFEKGKTITVGEVPSGMPIQTLHSAEHLYSSSDVVVFHAGSVKTKDLVQTSGGRVIAVSAYAPSLQEALDRAYQGVGQVNFDGKVYRRDIAHRYVGQTVITALPLNEKKFDTKGAKCSIVLSNFKPYLCSGRRFG
jgi:phosphoribosylamine--glycine ligase/phosphoribosylformylglycinamidine cyclo-ligase